MNSNYLPWQLAALFATGLFAGFVDSIAGGGGLITLPVLMSLGGDPRHVLGTNKLQASFGSASAAWHYSRAAQASFRDCRRAFALTVIGGAVGTWTVLRMDPSFLRRFIPVLLTLVALYVLFKPGVGEHDKPARMSGLAFDVVLGLGLGFYDGFFGPGVGTFWTMAFVLLRGLNLLKATGSTKIVNLGSNLASLAFFAARGEVFYSGGLCMGIGQLLGARLGSKLVVQRGTGFVRPVFILIVLAVTARLIYQGFR